jgi:NAD(P)-dependent dehydrogenase (short-subunit alcohol dehydrogenase family)
MSLINKVVVITGAGSGIGAATAKLFAKEGSKLVLSDINFESIERLCRELTKSGVDSISVETDVSNYKDVENLIAKTVDQYGHVDIMVNNAGIANNKLAKTAEHTLEDWDKVIAVNQTGVFYCMKTVLKQMLVQGYGNIVNVASLAGLKASGNNIAYSASKFAVVGMTKSAALEYASKGIRINAVCPGYTQTALFERVLEEKPDMHDKLLAHTPMRRFGEPIEIAKAILWLASNNTEFITGQTITLDGGLSL